MGWSMVAGFVIALTVVEGVAGGGGDGLTVGESIRTNETRTSDSQTFALGFFSPGDSTNRYVGIWYNQIPAQTVIWVANRENPLTDSSGILAVADDGNLIVRDEKGDVVWSSSVPAEVLEGKNVSAVLLDSGNLVLRDEGNRVLWESFDNPTDTYVPGMKFTLNLTSGKTAGLVSWRAANDPAPGQFSIGLDPAWPAQLLMWNGTARRWRSTWWSGKVFSELMANGRDYASYLTVATRGDELVLTIAISDTSLVSRFVMNRSGTVDQLTWSEANAWDLVWSRPKINCHLYAHCGPFGVCNRRSASECRCLEGFRPLSEVEWARSNWIGGCVRRTGLRCSSRDGFIKREKMKLPDLPTPVDHLSFPQCRSQCLDSCSCIAYSFANVSFGASPRCLIWTGNLMDLEENYTTGQDLYVRLPQSEIDALTVHLRSGGRHLFAIIVPTSSVTLLAAISCAYCLWRRRRRRGEKEIIKRRFTEGLPNLPLFEFDRIVAATKNFSQANKLGEGGFGAVYKGIMPKGEVVAVKRLSQSSGQGLQEFKNELQLIANLQHRNLVKLLGWCMHKEEKILIYEFLPNKSLDKILFDSSLQPQLDWGKRFHIAQGIVQGLLYLHRYSRLKVIHRDLKAGNILLDDSMTPKISDFGLARIFGGNKMEANTNRVVGTYGYMSPEYALDGHFSEKSDVFSFGVMLLELVSGKRSTGFYTFKHCLNLLGYAWLLWREDNLLDLIDPTMCGLYVLDEVIRCIRVGLLCVQEDPADRPDMSSVAILLGTADALLPAPKPPAFSIDRESPCNSSISSSLYFYSRNLTTVSGRA